MNRIIDKRGTGKTTRLLALAKQASAVIVCSRPEYIQRLAKIYDMDISNIDIISYHQYNSKYYDYSNRKILIDEIDGFLQTLSGECIGYSISIE